MTAFATKLDNAAGAATCNALQVGGSALIGYGAVGLAAGGTGIVPLAAGSLALMASELGCTWDPDGPGPTPEGPPQQLCYKGGSNFTIRVLTNGIFVGGSTPDLSEITRIAYDSTEQCQTGGSRDFYNIYWKNAAGTPGVTGLQWGGPCGGDSYTWVQVWDGNDSCSDPGPDPQPPIPPYKYTDPEDGCELNVTLKGFQVDPNGRANPVFKVEPEASLLRGGGVIGGCNFSPVIYTGGPPSGGQPPSVGPWDPSWDDPGGGLTPWQDFLNDLAGSVIANIVTNYLDKLYSAPIEPALYQLDAHCQFDSEGNPLKVQVEIPALPTYSALATRIEALVPIIQAHKNFDQPTCPVEPIPLLGEFRTIHFLSEEVSPAGKSCLRKRLRYRSESGIGLDELITYWAGFSFSAGPVIVKHRGSTWGTVTVWASSIDEGKRVILHAAAEAGIDANQVGRWEISGSSSTRLGMPGTMKVNQTGGYYWITARDGSDNRPIVGKT